MIRQIQRGLLESSAERVRAGEPAVFRVEKPPPTRARLA
jgi:hypothetical protein